MFILCVPKKRTKKGHPTKNMIRSHCVFSGTAELTFLRNAQTDCASYPKKSLLERCFSTGDKTEENKGNFVGAVLVAALIYFPLSPANEGEMTEHTSPGYPSLRRREGKRVSRG